MRATGGSPDHGEAAISFIGDIVGELTGGNKAARGARDAAKTQANIAEQAIALQRQTQAGNVQRQEPFVDAGSKAIAQQMALTGLNGTASQQDALSALLTGPEYTTALDQGEEAILQNASATGGLRGGNVNNSLARFRADLLASTFSNQFSRLGGLSSLGQNAAAGVGNQGLASTNAISDLLQQKGAALAGGQIAMGNTAAVGFNNAIKIAGAVAGAGGF
jgi:hypothetical protein